MASAEDEVISEARLRALYRYWDAKRGARAMPARADLDPANMPDLLAIVSLTEVLDGGLRFRYRLVGTETVDAFGFDPTGRDLDEALPAGAYAAYLIAMFREVAAERKALYAESEFLVDDRVDRHVRCLLMPLSADGETVDMVLSGQVMIALGVGETPYLDLARGRFAESVRISLG